MIQRVHKMNVHTSIMLVCAFQGFGIIESRCLFPLEIFSNHTKKQQKHQGPEFVSQGLQGPSWSLANHTHCSLGGPLGSLTVMCNDGEVLEQTCVRSAWRPGDVRDEGLLCLSHSPLTWKTEDKRDQVRRRWFFVVTVLRAGPV